LVAVELEAEAVTFHVAVGAAPTGATPVIVGAFPPTPTVVRPKLALPTLRTGSLNVTVQWSKPCFAGFGSNGTIEEIAGDVVSTRHVYTAGALTVELGFRARTLNVCTPSATGPGYDCGLLHDANAAPSSAHWKATGDALSVKVSVALVAFVGFDGPLVMTGLAVVDAASTELITSIDAPIAPRATATTTNFVALLDALVGSCVSMVSPTLCDERRVTCGV
jgi:hypothetical protein